MAYSKLGVASALLVSLLATAQAQAQAPPQQDAGLSGTATVTTGSSEFFDNYSIRLGLESAGPVLFRDAPDGMVEETTVYQVGPRVGFLFGHELKNLHRGGLGLSYLFVGKSDSRSLTFIPIYLLYEIGHPLILQAALGANATSGSKGFAGHYPGIHTGLVLRYSFLSDTNWSPVAVSPGIAARANYATGDMQYSSVFVGAQVEVMYNSNN